MSQNLCKSYLLERELGIHVWGTDQMKLAIYSSIALLDPDLVTAYLATNEVSGTGYTAGGVNLALTAGFPKLSNTPGVRKVLIDFVDVTINPANWSMGARCGLIYNASKANRGVAVVDFGSLLQVTTSFGVVWPVPDDSNAIIQLGA